MEIKNTIFPLNCKWKYIKNVGIFVRKEREKKWEEEEERERERERKFLYKILNFNRVVINNESYNILKYIKFFCSKKISTRSNFEN